MLNKKNLLHNDKVMDFLLKTIQIEQYEQRIQHGFYEEEKNNFILSSKRIKEYAGRVNSEFYDVLVQEGFLNKDVVKINIYICYLSKLEGYKIEINETFNNVHTYYNHIILYDAMIDMWKCRY